MSNKKKAQDFLNAALVVLVVLKLMGATTLSWGWVLSPLWLPIVLMLILIVAMAIVLVLLEIRDAFVGATDKEEEE